jgi:hypothetical protein
MMAARYPACRRALPLAELFANICWLSEEVFAEQLLANGRYGSLMMEYESLQLRNLAELLALPRGIEPLFQP